MVNIIILADRASMNKYYLPAEWQEQHAVQLTWPHANTDWLKNGLISEAEDYFVNLARTILKYENLIIVADNIDLAQRIDDLIPEVTEFQCNIYISESNDTWARDHGPITLISKQANNPKLVLDFEYNAWGGKFNYKKDNLITSNLYKNKAYINSDYTKIDYILEGGSIDSNGQGTVLTTSSCLFNANRNSNLSKEQIIEQLKKYLNIDNLVIIDNSFLYGDDTDGHIDMIARFCNTSTIVYTACDNEENLNYKHLKKLENELLDLKNNNTLFKNVNFIPLYIPNMIYNSDQELLPASYVNFLIINNAVLVPTYNDHKYDTKALDTFKKIFPDRDIIGIDSTVAIHEGGSLHCLTMQIPL